MTKDRHPVPSPDDIRREIQRVQFREKYARTLKSTFFALMSLAAVFVLIFTLVLPVYRVHGTQMGPTLEDGQLVATLPHTTSQRGDVVAFYYNSKVLIKRVIALEGDTIDIDSEGNVSLNGVPLDEPYLTEKALGECNITFPYQVPLGKVFVMGDDRDLSVDSRHTEISCVTKEQIIGTVILRIWPLDDLSVFK